MRSDFTTILRRLGKAGFSREFVHTAILPDWWQADCAMDPALLPDIEIRVARFLSVPVSDVQEGGQLRAPAYPDAKLRRTRRADPQRLVPAIHSAAMIAAAAVRSLRDGVPKYDPLPADAVLWREALERRGTTIALEDILKDLWQRGLPVVPIDLLPTPSFQGATFIVDDRPVIVVSHRQDEPGRVAFLVAHEAGHIAVGDCAPGIPVVDEEEQISDSDLSERETDLYATRLLAGRDTFPEVEASDFRQLANAAVELERQTGADAGGIIFAWASGSRDYATATMAVKALYRHRGARSQLRRHLDQWVDQVAATETDRALLRCVYHSQAQDALAD